MKRTRYGKERGLTLIEALVAIGVLALVGSLIYGAFDGMARSRKTISGLNERYHQGRAAIARISRDVQASFVSLHQPLVSSQSVRNTGFVGKDGGDRDRLDFTAFAHQNVEKDAHESDQCEVGFFTVRNPDTGGMDLVRREAKNIDLEITKGGVINVLAEGVEQFDIEYLDPLTGEWVSSWDSTQAAGQYQRLPLQIRVKIALSGGTHDRPIRFHTRVSLPAQNPIAFGIPR